MNEFRLLKASEIECRVGQCGKSQKGVGWCSILLYKDARCDQRLLDETFGIFGWTRKHEVINGQLCCTVSIQNPDTKEWIEKQDVGVESNTEAVKGSFSDAFKRACFNWGLGRELYTAPKIFITLNQNEMIEKNGKPSVSPKCVFTVAEIDYDKDRNINKLVLVDKDGTIRFSMGTNNAQATANTQQPRRASDDDGVSIDEQKAYAIPAVKQANDLEALKRVWNEFPELQSDQDFIDLVNNRKSQIAA